MSSQASPITRRSFVFGASVAVTGIVMAGRDRPLTAMQEATPDRVLADAGLPALDVAVTSAGYEGIPESLAAGRYLVTLTVAEDRGEFAGSIEFTQPVGVTAEEFVAALGPPPEAEGGPGAGTGATPAAASDAMGGPPAFLFESIFAGGVSVTAGQSAEVVLDLPAGTWVASAGGDPAQIQAPVIFEVTGEMPADLQEPGSDATITMGEYLIEVTAGELSAGRQIVQIQNTDAQPHFIAWFKGPEGLTEDDVEAVLESDLTGTPAAVDFDPNVDLVPVLFTATQSIGTSIWTPVDLEPGTHVLLCFFPDMVDGVPHAYHGMYTIIEIVA